MSELGQARVATAAAVRAWASAGNVVGCTLLRVAWAWQRALGPSELAIEVAMVMSLVLAVRIIRRVLKQVYALLRTGRHALSSVWRAWSHAVSVVMAIPRRAFSGASLLLPQVFAASAALALRAAAPRASSTFFSSPRVFPGLLLLRAARSAAAASRYRAAVQQDGYQLVWQRRQRPGTTTSSKERRAAGNNAAAGETLVWAPGPEVAAMADHIAFWIAAAPLRATFQALDLLTPKSSRGQRWATFREVAAAALICLELPPSAAGESALGMLCRWLLHSGSSAPTSVP